MAKHKPGISLIIHTKNEEQNIKACINSVKSIVNEVIVADMKSSDQTVSVARKLGARIIEVEDLGFADPARNKVITKAKFEWLLQLDADERITKRLKKAILKIVKQNKYDVVKFPRKNIIFGKWISHSGWWPDYQVKLVKKSNIKWTDKVHTQPEHTGRVKELPAKEIYAIEHFNYQKIDDMLEKITRYTKHERVLTEEENITETFLLEYLDKEFNWRYFEQLGYLDGMHGFILAKFMNFYRFVEFSRYWEGNNYSNLVDTQVLHKILLERKTGQYDTSEIDSLRSELEKVSGELHAIKDSRAFKLWQIYYWVKDRFIYGRPTSRPSFNLFTKKKSYDPLTDANDFSDFVEKANLTEENGLFTHVTSEEKYTLYQLVKPGMKNLVEIGSYLGVSANFIAAGIRDKAPKAKLYCVDSWKEDYMKKGRGTFEDFMNNTKNFKEYIKPLKGTSAQISKTFNKKIDYLFIDGDHTYRGVKIDVTKWFPKLKKGAVVVFPDVYWAKGVQRIIKEQVESMIENTGRLHNLYWGYKK